jgi:hypothetical protein
MSLDLQNYENVQDIIEHVKTDMIMFFRYRNLQLLVEKVRESRFHIHSPYSTLEEIKKADASLVIFICGHCIVS